MPPYSRFVVLGDSQSEGLNDLDERGEPLGWADRLADRLAATTSPGLHYANLAVRGCRARHVTETQLPAAVALEPDLAAVAVGMNDVLRHDYDLEATVDHIERAFAALAATGARVVTMTFPDIARMLPVMGWLRPREVRLNARIVAAAERHGVHVLDLFPLALCGDARMWSHDRIHGSTLGHTRIAAGMAHLLGLPDADPSWHVLPSDPARTHPLSVVGRDAWWAATFLGPFLTRQLLGRGTGADRDPKRPHLTPVTGSRAGPSGGTHDGRPTRSGGAAVDEP